jgi:hypothetical protein
MMWVRLDKYRVRTASLSDPTDEWQAAEIYFPEQMQVEAN